MEIRYVNRFFPFGQPQYWTPDGRYCKWLLDWAMNPFIEFQGQDKTTFDLLMAGF